MAYLILYSVDGAYIDTFKSVETMRCRVASQLECDPTDVSLDDRYDLTGDCIEFVVVREVGDVGTLDRRVPTGWKAIEK